MNNHGLDSDEWLLESDAWLAEADVWTTQMDSLPQVLSSFEETIRMHQMRSLLEMASNRTNSTLSRARHHHHLEKSMS